MISQCQQRSIEVWISVQGSHGSPVRIIMTMIVMLMIMMMLMRRRAVVAVIVPGKYLFELGLLLCLFFRTSLGFVLQLFRSELNG